MILVKDNSDNSIIQNPSVLYPCYPWDLKIIIFKKNAKTFAYLKKKQYLCEPIWIKM